MVNMENAEEVLQILERYTRLKQKEIPKELDEYLQYVAKTGDTVFKWSSLKYLFREKLLNVIKHFHDTTPRVDEIPQYPNVDPFNYESMKSSLLERLELFNAAPFTIQRLCELLIDPRKQYSRIDKFMRALEKNILVSTIEPGRKRSESENGDSLDSVVNGDLSLDVNVDIDMENEAIFNIEAQNGKAAAAAAAGLAIAAADDEDEDPLVERENDRQLTETPNVSHKADDDILPNPKKVKLDLNEEELRKVTSEEKENKTVEKAEVKLESEIVKKTDTSPTFAFTLAEERETEKDFSKKVVTTDEDTPKKKQLNVVKEKKLNVSGGEKKPEAEMEKLDCAEKQKTEEFAKKSEESTIAAVAVADPILKTENTEASPAKVKNSKENIDSPNRTSVNKEHKTTEKHELVKDEIDANEKTTDGAKIATESRKTIDTEIELLETAAVTDKTTVDKLEKETEEDGIPINAAASTAKAATATKTEVTVDAVKVAEVFGKNRITTEKVDKTEKQLTADAVAITESKVESGKVDKEEIETTVTETSAVKSPIIEPIEEDPPTASTATVAAAAPAPVVVVAAAAQKADTKPDTPPALALNDQPMEDELQPINVAVIVDEVIMVETSGGATAMATDVIEPTKDEPAGMEIDDTSQEAMDQ